MKYVHSVKISVYQVFLAIFFKVNLLHMLCVYTFVNVYVYHISMYFYTRCFSMYFDVLVRL